MLELKRLAGREWNIFPTSARTGEGLNAALDWLIAAVAKKPASPGAKAPKK